MSIVLQLKTAYGKCWLEVKTARPKMEAKLEARKVIYLKKSYISNYNFRTPGDEAGLGKLGKLDKAVFWLTKDV